MSESIFQKRRKTILRIKFISAMGALIFLVPIAYGYCRLVTDIVGIKAFSTHWWLIVTFTGTLMFFWFIVGYFAGSLTIDNNVTSILSRMNTVEKKVLRASLDKDILDLDRKTQAIVASDKKEKP
ncbi:hypothetical protein KAR91_57915 [Candidatus Pacearchaeota archaeon]|nr:hypothetical protein [Candidatus Pacearchaeota archaeon]